MFDRIDLRDALASSTFTGTNAHEAFQQGYIYLVEHGTTVYMDRNGNAPDYGYQGDVALVNLEGVAADALRLGYCNGHFIALRTGGISPSGPQKKTGPPKGGPVHHSGR